MGKDYSLSLREGGALLLRHFHFGTTLSWCSIPPPFTLQASKRAEQEEKARLRAIDPRVQRGVPLQPSLRVSALEDRNILSKGSQEAFSAYFRFKELTHELKNSPGNSSLRKEMREIGRSIFKDKEIFAHIEKIDSNIAKEIQKEAQIKIHTLDRGRGGYSR